MAFQKLAAEVCQSVAAALNSGAMAVRAEDAKRDVSPRQRQKPRQLHSPFIPKVGRQMDPSEDSTDRLAVTQARRPVLITAASSRPQRQRATKRTWKRAATAKHRQTPAAHTPAPPTMLTTAAPLAPSLLARLNAIERLSVVMPEEDDLTVAVTADDRDLFRQTQRLSGKGPPKPLPTTRPSPAVIQLGAFEISTWFSSPYPVEYRSLPVVYLCSHCLNYYNRCSPSHPPGREIYRKDEMSVFEVDGNAAKVYCQNVCLLGKLFLGCKILFDDVEPLLFYVLTRNDAAGCHFVGYFSKEKDSADGFNLACIATLPPYQQSGYGRFLIDFSYLLSRKEKLPGTPERPLTKLGRISYRSYWRSAILEWLRAKEGCASQFAVQTMIDETGIALLDLTNTLRALKMLIGGVRGLRGLPQLYDGNGGRLAGAFG